MGRGNAEINELADVERFALDIIDSEQVIREEAQQRVSEFCETVLAVGKSYPEQLAELLFKESVAEQVTQPESRSNQLLAESITSRTIGWDDAAEGKRQGSDRSSDDFVRLWLQALHNVPRSTPFLIRERNGTMHTRAIGISDQKALCGRLIKEDWECSLPRGSWHSDSLQRCEKCEEMLAVAASSLSSKVPMVTMAAETRRYQVLNDNRLSAFRQPVQQLASEQLAEIARKAGQGQARMKRRLQDLMHEQLYPLAEEQAIDLTAELVYLREPRQRLDELFSSEDHHDGETAKTVGWLEAGFRRLLDVHLDDEGLAAGLLWPSQNDFRDKTLAPCKRTLWLQDPDRLQVELCARFIGAFYPRTIDYLDWQGKLCSLQHDCVSIWVPEYREAHKQLLRLDIDLGPKGLNVPPLPDGSENPLPS